MGQFKLMPKMETTEPSVILKLANGGTVKKAMGGAMKKAMGGAMRNPTLATTNERMPMAAMPSERGVPMAARRGVAPKMTVPSGGMRGPMMRKKGGEVESKSMHKAEMSEMKGIKKELKSHEDKPASKAHKGLKTGGAVPKYNTGGVIEKYAKGGKMKKAYGGAC